MRSDDLSSNRSGGTCLLSLSHTSFQERLEQVTNPVEINATVNALAAAMDQCYQLLAVRTGHELGVGCMVSARDGAAQRKLMPQIDAAMLRLRQEAGVQRVVTGGGPFCMERCASAAVQAGMVAVEVELNLPSEHAHRNGGYVAVKMPRHNFDPRIMTMLAQCDVIFGLDGGIGTRYEIMAAIQRNQLQAAFGDDDGVPHVPRFYSGVRLIQPVICVGESWQFLRADIEQMKESGMVGTEELKFLHFVDTLDEGVDVVVKFSHEWRERACAVFGEELVQHPPLS